ncbi:MAG: hypothetical protein ACFNQF_04250 [Bacteroides sp.]
MDSLGEIVTGTLKGSWTNAPGREKAVMVMGTPEVLRRVNKLRFLHSMVSLAGLKAAAIASTASADRKADSACS